MTVVAEKPSAPVGRIMVIVTALLLIGTAAVIGWRPGVETEQRLHSEQVEVFSPEAARLGVVAGQYEQVEVFSPEAARLGVVAGQYEQVEVFSPEAARLGVVAGQYEQVEVFSPEAARLGTSE